MRGLSLIRGSMGGLGEASSLRTLEDMLRRSGREHPCLWGPLCPWGTRYEGWAHKEWTLIYLGIPSTRNLGDSRRPQKEHLPLLKPHWEAPFENRRFGGGGLSGRTLSPQCHGGPFNGNSES
jgi:hypothetical protein